jgi:hypothetical protein
MSRRYMQSASCSPSSRADSYIYSIAPAYSSSLAAITSADEVLLVDGSKLATTAVSRLGSGHEGLTTLTVGNDGRDVYCGNSGGRVSCFDVRSGVKSGHIDIGSYIVSWCSERSHNVRRPRRDCLTMSWSCSGDRNGTPAPRSNH